MKNPKFCTLIKGKQYRKVPRLLALKLEKSGDYGDGGFSDGYEAFKKVEKYLSPCLKEAI